MLIQISDLSLHYGPRSIFDHASVVFSHGQKIAVIGRNGAGKSTLCKLILGEEEPSSGAVRFNSKLRLSYLEQQDPFSPDEIVTDFLERYSGQPGWECGKTAAKFGLGPDMLYVPIGSLSGGYQMRVKLTAMALKSPNFLILDEPTNYLDLSTLLFLERFLQEFRGGFLIVSHDREFLKRTCEQTLEVENGKLTPYNGGIEAYFSYKQAQLEQKMAHNKSVEREKKHLQTFVDRFGSKASLAASAQSKRKQMARLKTIEIEHPMSNVTIRMPQVPVKKGTLLTTEKLAIGYPEKRVAGTISFHLNKGSHTAILGDNGQGKSTFLKTIAGELAALSGKFTWGHAVDIGYYAQHVYQRLNDKHTVYEALYEIAGDTTPRQDVLDMAGSFLFQGDEVQKKVRVLSGGERARLCLAGLLLSKKDVLLLDEPTNHLDFETVEALAQALKTYQGSLMFISHDRTFVSVVATAILEVKNQTIQLYPGTYEEYVYHLEQEMD